VSLGPLALANRLVHTATLTNDAERNLGRLVPERVAPEGRAD